MDTAAPPDSADELPDTITVKLRAPFRKSASEDMVEEVTFRTPTWAELKKVRAKGLSQNEVAGLDTMLVTLNTDHLTQADFDRMKSLDAQACIKAILPFMGTAETPE